MPDLSEHGAGRADFPLHVGGVSARELPFERITSVMRVGEGARLAPRLRMPKPGRSERVKAGRVLWSGHWQAMLVGPEPPEGAAATDQSDAWCRVELSGRGAEAVMARLVPLDLRPAAFPEGAVARTLIGHMPGLVVRAGPEAFELWVYSSMAGTLAHDLRRAMTAVAVRIATGA